MRRFGKSEIDFRFWISIFKPTQLFALLALPLIFSIWDLSITLLPANLVTYSNFDQFGFALSHFDTAVWFLFCGQIYHLLLNYHFLPILSFQSKKKNYRIIHYAIISIFNKNSRKSAQQNIVVINGVRISKIYHFTSLNAEVNIFKK